jgi:hypothetical protein
VRRQGQLQRREAQRRLRRSGVFGHICRQLRRCC